MTENPPDLNYGASGVLAVTGGLADSGDTVSVACAVSDFVVSPVVISVTSGEVNVPGVRHDRSAVLFGHRGGQRAHGHNGAAADYRRQCLDPRTRFRLVRFAGLSVVCSGVSNAPGGEVSAVVGLVDVGFGEVWPSTPAPGR